MIKCIECGIKPRPEGRRVCHSCRQRKNIKNNPITCAYHLLKNHAKARGKEFTISLEYFKQFCYKTDYIDKKGREAHSYHVDRIREELGYVEGNLQVLENRENIRKYKKWVYRDENGNNHFTTITQSDNISEPDDDCPF